MKYAGRLDLTYCSNIHAGERWDEVSAALSHALPCVRDRLAHVGPFAIGLRLSAAAARTLESPTVLDDFRAFLNEGDFYVPTINGFPYGAFHGTRVKERVYQPDWRDTERIDYSNRLARILVALADPDTGALSISTVPGAFRSHVTSESDVETIAENLLAHAAYLRHLRLETGKCVTLAIEPEPACYMETVDEAIAFFRKYLFDDTRVARVAQRTGTSLTVADVATHLGVCLDACHMAVEFETPDRVFRNLEAAGIAIAKIQLSSALRLAASAATSPDLVLGRFADDTYLHQVVIADTGGVTRYTDLPEALDAFRRDHAPRGEWRVHFHVPIFMASMGQFDTTQSYLADVLRLVEQARISTCLEVETYTWDVLPPQYRTSDVCTAIARELAWVRDRLTL
jgi:sugar phosphate isomerase/epimerase